MSKKRNVFQMIALFLMLVVLPGGSWYYLQAGFDYQKQARSELSNYGTIDSLLNLMSTDSQKIAVQDFKGKLSVYSFVSNTDLDAKRINDWNLLHEQFEDTKRVKFVLAALDDSVDFAAQIDLPKGKDCIYLGKKEALKILANLEQADIEKGRTQEGRYATNKISDLTNYPFHVLVDTSLVVRNYYRSTEEQDMKRMIEHIAMIVPREKSKKPVLIREKEK